MKLLEELLKEAVDTIQKLPPEKQREAVGVIKGMLLSETAEPKKTA